MTPPRRSADLERGYTAVANPDQEPPTVTIKDHPHSCRVHLTEEDIAQLYRLAFVPEWAQEVGL